MLDATLKSELCKLKPSSPDSHENSMMNHIAAVNDERDFKHFVEQNCFQNYANNNPNVRSKSAGPGTSNHTDGSILSGSNSVNEFLKPAVGEFLPMFLFGRGH